MPRGTLIAVEGIDGAGKTTQARRLVAWLEQSGRAARYAKEPTDGRYGAELRASAVTGRLPPERELALFVADRREHVREVLGPALARGEVVVVDRYYLSTAAYQGVRGLDPQAILAENEAFAPAPDLCVLVDLDPAAGVGRVRRRDTAENLFEREEDLRRCRALFLAIERPWIRRFDGSLPIDELEQQIRAAVLAVLPPDHEA